ncbi:type I 3-dehydroquinate dehydratase [Mesobacillus harenae]|uniref:type I 3-dehydroquinate dehydratase n=1 Tax=Mesobacillus harenae TaxID=2213203 RepID=UPI001580B07F|nr:type I 3-dehydroquinate dehydratase [Mesobacillus harenae]
MKIVLVKGVAIGKGIPKICVPIVGETVQQLLEEAKLLKTIDADLVEWRVDFFKEVRNIEKVISALAQLHDILKEKPLIFTFRSAREGGQTEVSSDFYSALNKAAVRSGMADIIDVELLSDESVVKELIEYAHSFNVYVILSNHDFQQTPSKDEIIKRLRKAQSLEGDLPKIAVMPSNSSDVITLLDATQTMKEQYADRPIITMSMAGTGVISRLAGEAFGSAVTFGSAAAKASAPGQIDAGELRNILSILHKSIN